MHHRLRIPRSLILKRLTSTQQVEGGSAPFMDGGHGGVGTFTQRLLQTLQFLSLFSVSAEEISCEDEFPCHGHDHAHKDIPPLDTVGEIGIHVRAIKDGVFHAVDDFLVTNLRGEVAGAGVGEFGEPEDPLLDVAAEHLTLRVKVIFISIGDDGVGAAALGGKDLLLEGADLVFGCVEFRMKAAEFCVFLFDGNGDFMADNLFHAG